MEDNNKQIAVISIVALVIISLILWACYNDAKRFHTDRIKEQKQNNNNYYLNYKCNCWVIDDIDN
jgi:hypothetical protein